MCSHEICAFAPIDSLDENTSRRSLNIGTISLNAPLLLTRSRSRERRHKPDLVWPLYARCFSFGTAHHSVANAHSTSHMWNSEVICDACEPHHGFTCRVRTVSSLHDALGFRCAGRVAAKHFESFLLRANIQSRDFGDPAVSSLLPLRRQVRRNSLYTLQSTAFRGQSHAST